MSSAFLKEYYGRTLKSAADLKTSACCVEAAPTEHIRKLLEDIHPDVKAKFYGCGLVAPTALKGARILDLGCGAGHDAFLLSRMAGEAGHIVGLDMTGEQLATARSHIAWHRERYGYARDNVEFIEGYIEDLSAAGIAPDSIDIIVSNCVVNLSPDKRQVFKEAHRALRQGGEFYFCDVYADRRLPRDVQEDPILHAECLGGALYWNDFLSLAREAGFSDPRLVTSREILVSDPVLKAHISPARFFSATYRLFKLSGLEPACEDYGQAAIYRGGMEGAEKEFWLDGHHRFEAGRVVPVCGNTLSMLSRTRFAAYFDVVGSGRHHYGIFPGCGTAMPFASSPDGAAAACC